MSRPHRISHTVDAEWPCIAKGRFAERIRRDSPEGCGLALLGLPDDTGICLNGGRPGAAGGPAALRAALAAYGASWDLVARRNLDVLVFDAGDVEPARGTDVEALLATHQRVEEAVLDLHRLGLVPVCIGGGHDLSFPSITALSRHLGQPVGGINVDAHLDVRERIGSGMAFRRLIETGALDARRFVEFGLGRFANDAKDVQWLEAQGATLFALEHTGSNTETRPARLLERVVRPGGAAFLSIDLDALAASLVSGVSAANPAGLELSPAAELAEACGSEAAIRHFDIMELSPIWDASGRSARVAAHLLMCFVTGFCRRIR